jgi:hypothetical protein
MGYYLKILLFFELFLFPFLGHAQFITHGEWAKRLVKAMGIEEYGIPENATPNDYISLLTGGQSTYVPMEPNHGTLVSLDINVNSSGTYNLLLQSSGGRMILRIDDTVRFVENGNKNHALVYAGRFILKRGLHKLTVLPQEKADVTNIYFMAPCLPRIQPPGGWVPEKLLSFGDKAVTIIQALNMEDRLPAVSSFQISHTGESGEVQFYIPENGVFSFYIPVSQNIDSEFRIDNCAFSRIINKNSTNSPVWREIGTYPLPAGQHKLMINVYAGKLNNTIMVVRRDTSVTNYMNLLRKLNPLEGEITKNVSMELAIANLLHPVFASKRKEGPDAFFYIEEELPRMPSEKEAPPYTQPISPVLPPGI